jgi:hypothetical protein
MTGQKKDEQLADLAWRVLYVPQAVMAFRPLDGAEKPADEVYRMRSIAASKKN